jgi:hypothetical protein
MGLKSMQVRGRMQEGMVKDITLMLHTVYRKGQAFMEATLRRTHRVAHALCAVALLALPAITLAEEVAASPPSPSVDTRLQSQEQRIKDLELRIQNMESSAMSGTLLQPVDTSKPRPELRDPDAPATLDVSSGAFREPPLVETGASLASDTFPGSWPLFGTEYRMKIGGYFKLDALYDINGSGDKNQLLVSQIPVDGSPEAGRDGYFNMLVRETRYNFDIRKTTADEPAQKFFLEMDFFDGSSSSPRLRHAYVQYGNLIVGQTWSTLTELRAVNYMIDFAYGDVIVGTRSKQVRWQQQLAKHWWWALGVENLDNSSIDRGAVTNGVASPRLPLLAVRLTHESDSSVVMLGASVNELRWDGEGVGPDAEEMAWVAVLDGRINISDLSYATFQLTTGNGTAGALGSLGGLGANATLFPDGRLELNRHWNTSLGYTRKLTDKLSSNLNFAYAALSSDYERSPDSLESAWAAHANLIYEISSAMSTGVEYMWGERENVDGASGDAARVQTMVMYSF